MPKKFLQRVSGGLCTWLQNKVLGHNLNQTVNILKNKLSEFSRGLFGFFSLFSQLYRFNYISSTTS